MFSDPQIQRLTSRFVTVSFDPRDPKVDREPFKYKATKGGFELSSELKVKGKPVTLTVGK